MTANFWYGKRVLVTGHTGFKGSWLALWLKELGAEVTGLSLAPQTEPSLHRLLDGACEGPGILDIRDRTAVLNHVLRSRPQIVFHLAAQALVRAGYRNPAETYDINVLGTANLLDALRAAEDVRSIVVVTTDKVYHNPETGSHSWRAIRSAARIPIRPARRPRRSWRPPTGPPISRHGASGLPRRGPAMSSAAATGRKTG